MKNFLRSASLLCMFLLSANLYAQVPNWEWIERGSAQGYVYATGIEIDETGNVYAGMSYQSYFSLGGASVLNNQRDPDPGFYKLDATGKAEWAKKLHSAGTDRNRSFCLDGDGRSYVLITITNTMTISGVEYSSANGAYVLLAYKPNGELRWAHQMSLSNAGGLSINSNNELTFTGSYYETLSWAEEDYSLPGKYMSFVAAMDLEGKELWLQELVSGASSIFSPIETEDAYYSYIVPSRTDTIGIVGSDLEILPTEIREYHICSFNKDWSLNWTRVIGSSSETSSPLVLYGMVANSTSDIYTYGRVIEDLLVDGKEYPTTTESSGCADGFMVKLDKDGSTQKVATLGSKVSCDNIYSMEIGSDDKVYMAGASSTTISYEDLTISLPTGGTFLVKMDQDLKPLWYVRAIGESNGSDISISDIAINKKNDLVVMGRYNADIDFGDTSFVYSGPGANKYIFVAKIQNDFTDAIAPYKAPAPAFEVFPNPGNGKFNIGLKGTGNAFISISNINGQELWAKNVQLEMGNIPVQLGAQPGVYLISVQTEKEVMTYRYVQR